MILRFLKSNHVVHFVLLPLVVFALRIRSFTHPELSSFFEGENAIPLYGAFNGLLTGMPMLNNLLATLFIILLSFFILHMNTRYDFIRIRTFLPSIIFVLAVSGLGPLHPLHPVYFGALFLLISINKIFASDLDRNVHSNAFDAGFSLGVGSLFYLNLIFYVPVIWIGFLLMIKNRDFRVPVLSAIGITLPWLFVFSWHFLRDDTGMLWEIIVQNFARPDLPFKNTLLLKIYTGFLVILTLRGSFFFLAQYDSKTASERKYFQVLFLVFAISLALFFLSPGAGLDILIIMAIPLTFLISNFLIGVQSRFWGDFIVVVFLILTVSQQFVP